MERKRKLALACSLSSFNWQLGCNSKNSERLGSRTSLALSNQLLSFALDSNFSFNFNSDFELGSSSSSPVIRSQLPPTAKATGSATATAALASGKLSIACNRILGCQGDCFDWIVVGCIRCEKAKNRHEGQRSHKWLPLAGLSPMRRLFARLFASERQSEHSCPQFL